MLYRTKIIKKIGSSVGIIINTEEKKLYNIKEGDHVEISFKKLEDK